MVSSPMMNTLFPGARFFAPLLKSMAVTPAQCAEVSPLRLPLRLQQVTPPFLTISRYRSCGGGLGAQIRNGKLVLMKLTTKALGSLPIDMSQRRLGKLSGTMLSASRVPNEGQQSVSSLRWVVLILRWYSDSSCMLKVLSLNIEYNKLIFLGDKMAKFSSLD
jgi:hypothetical protein